MSSTPTRFADPQPMGELLVVGRIGRAHGIRGEVTVEMRTDAPELRFATGANRSDDVSLQRIKAVESNRRIGRRVGARAFDQNLITHRQRDRQRIHVLLI